jgi:hypothetical protein
MWMLLTTKSKEHSSSSTDMSDVTSTLDKLTSAPKILTNLKCSILYVTLTLEAFRLDKRRKNVPKFKKMVFYHLRDQFYVFQYFNFDVEVVRSQNLRLRPKFWNTFSPRTGKIIVVKSNVIPKINKI